MIKNFLIINFIGKNNDTLGLKIDRNFYTSSFNTKIKNNDKLVSSILNLIKKYKVNLDANFSILVNSGPGSFSSLRVALAVAKGIKLAKKISIYSYKNSDLDNFNLANIDFLIKKKLLEKNLIKPLYIS
jgi:tRNA A37 threonylcarbamoyladenosine modification protein TsaB|tara:strand:+ start:472 stop:858 length:387 start_codon:yes stop_codon:yes gene_type:complete